MEISELGKNPISSDSPAGADVRYEPEYEELSAEMEKLSAPGASSSVNWGRIQELASTILAEKSKDLLCASYLSIALLRTQKIDGLATSFTFYNDLLKTFWEDLFPVKKRMRGRKNAVEWFFEQAEEFLKENEMGPQPGDKMKAILDGLESIDSFLGENMEEPPSARGLLTVLQMVPVAAEKPPAPAPGAAAPPGAPAAAAGSATIASPQDVTKVLNSAFQQFRQVASYYMENELANPLAYSLRRLSAWMTIQNLPPEADGNTRIPPPQEQIKKVLDGLQGGADWENLVKATEGKVGQTLFWLDLSRMSYEALGSLGDKFKNAQDAVASETAKFVQRMSGIENLAFSDGTPFADNDTKKWLKEIAQSDSASQNGGGGVSGGGGDSGEAIIDEEYQKAIKLFRGKKLPEAVRTIQDHLNRSPSGKMRLLWRMSLVRLLLQSKKVNQTLPHLEQILNDIKTYRLDEWDPGLAVRGFKVVIGGLGSFKDEKSKAQMKEALDYIAKLSPVDALGFDKLM